MRDPAPSDPAAAPDPELAAPAVGGLAGLDELQRLRPHGFTPRGVWELAWPAVTSNLLFTAVGIIDTAVIKYLGSSALAAAMFGDRIFFILQAVLFAVTTGTTALVARAWGASDPDEAERVNRASLWLCLGIAAGMTVPGVFFAEELTFFFELDAETRAMTIEFIRWLSVFNLGFAVNMSIGAGLRAAGDTITPLWLGALANVVNVFLVLGLVLGWFGLPAIGIRGAAIAAGAGFAASALFSLWLWWRGRLVLGIGPPQALERERVRRLLRVGYPAALEQLAVQGGFLLFVAIVSRYGTEPAAAYGVGVRILAVSFVVGFGFSIAASTLVGQHLGAGDAAGAAHSGWRAMRLAIGSMLVLGLSVVLFSEPIAHLLTDDPEVIRLTVVFIYILGAMQPLMAIEFTLGGALRGAGDTRFPLLTVLAGLVCVRGSLSGLFWWLGLSVEWIFAALIGDYLVKGAMLTWRFRSGRWQRAIG